jgi:hypothetical protein
LKEKKMTDIFTPVKMVEAIKRTEDSGYSLCTKIHLGKYEISIAMDQSLCKGRDLSRTTIRVYRGVGFKDDVTHLFLGRYNRDRDVEIVDFTDSKHLYFIMNEIEFDAI